MEFLSEFSLYLIKTKKVWLVPVIVALGLFRGLVILTQGTAVAPFIYTFY